MEKSLHPYAEESSPALGEKNQGAGTSETRKTLRQPAADVPAADGFNPKTEIGFTEGNEGNKAGRICSVGDTVRKSSDLKSPTSCTFVRFVAFCKMSFGSQI